MYKQINNRIFTWRIVIGSVQSNQLKMLYLLSLICCSSIVFSQGKKFIPDYNCGTSISLSYGDTAIVFSVSNSGEKIKCKIKRCYYYYHHQNVHHNIGGYIGHTLNGSYTKQLRSGQLIEKGEYKNGLKHGTWLEWFSSGKIYSEAKWKKGRGKGLKTVYMANSQVNAQYRWRGNNWRLTRKYARLEEKKEKQRLKEQKRIAKENEKSQRRIKKDRERELKKSQVEKKYIWPFNKKNKQSNVTVKGPVMGEMTVEDKRKNVWNVFRRKDEKENAINENKKVFFLKKKGKKSIKEAE